MSVIQYIQLFSIEIKRQSGTQVQNPVIELIGYRRIRKMGYFNG
jgi:hypothetical protein